MPARGAADRRRARPRRVHRERELDARSPRGCTRRSCTSLAARARRRPRARARFRRSGRRRADSRSDESCVAYDAVAKLEAYQAFVDRRPCRSVTSLSPPSAPLRSHDARAVVLRLPRGVETVAFVATRKLAWRPGPSGASDAVMVPSLLGTQPVTGASLFEASASATRRCPRPTSGAAAAVARLDGRARPVRAANARRAVGAHVARDRRACSSTRTLAPDGHRRRPSSTFMALPVPLEPGRRQARFCALQQIRARWRQFLRHPSDSRRSMLQCVRPRR